MATFQIQTHPVSPQPKDRVTFETGPASISLPAETVASLQDLLELLIANPELVAFLIQLILAIFKSASNGDDAPPPKAA